MLVQPASTQRRSAPLCICFSSFCPPFPFSQFIIFSLFRWTTFSGSRSARLVITFGDAIKDDLFKEKVGNTSVKQLSRTAKERRPGSLGYAEAMLVAYNRKCKFPLRWTKLYEKNLGTTDGLDVDIDSQDVDADVMDEIDDE